MSQKVIETIINMGDEAPQTDWGVVVVILAFLF